MFDASGSDASGLLFRLDPILSGPRDQGTVQPWSEVIESCVQQTLGELLDPKYQGGLSESTRYIKALQDNCSGAATAPRAQHPSPNAELFGECKLAYEFRLEGREYSCISVTADILDLDTSTLDAQNDGERQLLASLWSDRSLRRDLQSGTVDATGRELLAVLLRHLVEDMAVRGVAPSAGSTILHSPRRALIANWALRLEAGVRKAYKHQDDIPSVIAYPFVDLIPLGETHVVALMVAPKDPLAIDEIVDEEHRLAPISLAVYDCAGLARQRCAEDALPLFREGLARILYSAQAHRHGQTVEASFGELSAINRAWFRTAADGAAGVLKGASQERFDGLRFGEAIVRELLCSLKGVEQTEVYPFDRALVFGESFFDDTIRKDAPIPMLVLEASVVSNNPSDKGQSMTRRERALSDTKDHECNMAAKSIQDQDAIQLYLHPGIANEERQFILSAKSHLVATEKSAAFRARAKSTDDREANRRAYGLPPIEGESSSAIAEAIANILLRVDKTAQEEQKSKVGDVESKVSQRFTADARRLRLGVAARADVDGLYFAYEHGLTLKEDVPDLHGILDAYSTYLGDRFQKEDDGFREEKYRSENLSRAEIKSLVEAERRSQTRTDLTSAGRTKVVLIQFSYDLHDANMKLLREDRRSDSDAASVLGEEYSFTIVLIADNELPKTVPQLERERKDLQTMLQILVAQLWADRLNEHQYLTRRTSTMIGSMKAALHSLKNSLDENKLRQVKGLLAGFERMAGLTKPVPEDVELHTAQDFFKCALGVEAELSISALANVLSLSDKAAQVRFTLDAVSLPALRASWVIPAVKDAVMNVLKNAFERATASPANGKSKALVRCRVEFVPLPTELSSRRGFLDIVVENSGVPIPPARLKRLQELKPQPLGEDESSASSSGIGIYLARTALQDTIGHGADILYENVGERTVQARVRLPAAVAIPDGLEEAEAATVLQQPRLRSRGPYLLYVEDDASISSHLRTVIEDVAAQRGLQLHHATSLQEVRRILEGGPPRLAITDFNIPEQTGGLPESKWGCEVLRFLRDASPMSAAGKRDVPPVWIWTAEDKIEVMESLKDLGDGLADFRFIDSQASDGSTLLSTGAVCIMGGMKAPGVFAAHWSNAVLRNLQTVPTVRDGHRNGRRTIRTSAGRLLRLPVEPSTFGSRIAQAAQTMRLTDGRAIVLATEVDASGIEDLDRAFALWASVAVSDPDRVNDSELAYPPHRRGRHKRVVLLVPEMRTRALAVPVAVQYALLSRNVWLLCQDIPDEEIASIWLSFRAEQNGALSTLRHDLQNWGGLESDSLRSRAVDLVTECESALRPKEVLSIVDRAFSTSQTPWSTMSAHFDVLRSREESGFVARTLFELEGRLAQIASEQKDFHLAAKAGEFEVRVSELRRMLGVSK